VKASRAAALLAAASLLVATASHAATIRVFAAASLTEAFQEIAALYESENPGDTVELNFAGSQTLRFQIEQGAPADVFASADMAHMQALEDSGLVERAAVFARNRLVIVTPAAKGRVGRIADVARPGLRIVLAEPSVPAGRYAAEVIAKIAATAARREEFVARVEANIASRETNVRGVLSKVMLGEADAAFVYATDAAVAAHAVRVIAIPDSLNAIAEYPIALLAASEAPEQATRFVYMVLGPLGWEVLKRRGFETPQ
jgi:molybdate transport system substrate-binding protein